MKRYWRLDEHEVHLRLFGSTEIHHACRTPWTIRMVLESGGMDRTWYCPPPCKPEAKKAAVRGTGSPPWRGVPNDSRVITFRRWLDLALWRKERRASETREETLEGGLYFQVCKNIFGTIFGSGFELELDWSTLRSFKKFSSLNLGFSNSFSNLLFNRII